MMLTISHKSQQYNILTSCPTGLTCDPVGHVSDSHGALCYLHYAYHITLRKLFSKWFLENALS